jgi:hypothetical protein
VSVIITGIIIIIINDTLRRDLQPTMCTRVDALSSVSPLSLVHLFNCQAVRNCSPLIAKLPNLGNSSKNNSQHVPGISLCLHIALRFSLIDLMVRVVVVVVAVVVGRIPHRLM